MKVAQSPVSPGSPWSASRCDCVCGHNKSVYLPALWLPMSWHCPASNKPLKSCLLHLPPPLICAGDKKFPPAAFCGLFNVSCGCQICALFAKIILRRGRSQLKVLQEVDECKGISCETATKRQSQRRQAKTRTASLRPNIRLL